MTLWKNRIAKHRARNGWWTDPPNLVLQEHGLLVREESGFPAIPKNGLDPSQYFGENEAIGRQMQEQFTGRAVAVLGRAGLNAWRNSADPISPLVLTPLVDSINSSNLVRRLPPERS
jgi:hypothetical protein